MVARPAIGVRQEPSKISSILRSALTRSSVFLWFSGLRIDLMTSLSDAISMAIAPWATAGSNSVVLIDFTLESSMPKRFNPAIARNVASATLSSSFLRRV